MLHSKRVVKLSNLHTKGTISCLQPNVWYLSPGLGNLFSASSPLLPNSLQLPFLTKGLAGDLYHQRKTPDGRRYGPCAVANSKSLPVKWLSAGDMGWLAGIAEMQVRRGKAFDASFLDNQLKLRDITCNYVQGTWTGISLSRYRMMINKISDNIEMLRKNEKTSLPPLGLLALQMCIWDKAHSKEDLLEYLIALQKAMDTPIFSAESGLDSDEGRLQWCASAFCPEEIDATWQSSWRSLSSSLAKIGDTEATHTAATSLELIAAHLATHASNKSAIKQGRYVYTPSTYPSKSSPPTLKASSNSQASKQAEASTNIKADNGADIPSRPDCVEVVVREIVDNLLFDRATNEIDQSRLPASAHPRLKSFYQQYLSGVLSDSPVLITPHQQSSSSSSSSGTSSTPLSSTHTTAGDSWFQLCSNLPDCAYLCHVDLASNLQGHYELTPSLANVCRVLGKLLAGSHTQWSRLDDLAAFWNDHMARDSSTSQSVKSDYNFVPRSPSNSDSQPKRPPLAPGTSTGSKNHLTVKEYRTMFRAPLSDTEMIYRDVGHLHVAGSPYAMQAELEPAHQLAAVKFVRVATLSSTAEISPEDVAQIASTGSSSSSSKSGEMSMQLLKQRLLQQLWKTEEQPTSAKSPNSIFQRSVRLLLHSILLENDTLMNPALNHNLESISMDTDPDSKYDTFARGVFSLVSTKWGEERWKPSLFAETGELTMTQSTMSLTLQGQAQAEYETLVHTGWRQLVQLYDVVSQEELLHDIRQEFVDIFVWFLRENNAHISTKQLEEFLVLIKNSRPRATSKCSWDLLSEPKIIDAVRKRQIPSLSSKALLQQQSTYDTPNDGIYIYLRAMQQQLSYQDILAHRKSLTVFQLGKLLMVRTFMK